MADFADMLGGFEDSDDEIKLKKKQDTKAFIPQEHKIDITKEPWFDRLALADDSQLCKVSSDDVVPSLLRQEIQDMKGVNPGLSEKAFAQLI